MMNEIVNTEVWAEKLFSKCDLGDKRRTKRLITIAKNHAMSPSNSSVESCKGNAASIEATYRLFRNNACAPDAIAEGAFQAVADMTEDYVGDILAIEDTTSISYHHQCPGLGCVGNSVAHARGFMVHSVLASTLDGVPIGLIEQERWRRDIKNLGGSRNSRERPYKEKETFKWQRASEKMSRRLEHMEKIISVCDREADVFEYLDYKRKENQRFVVRAKYCRRLERQPPLLIRDAMIDAPKLGEKVLEIPQQNNRKAREVRLNVHAKEIAFYWPKGMRKGRTERLKLNAVLVQEEGKVIKKDEKLEWILLTSEPIETYADACRVIDIYTKRWLIEDFHKAWKSGTNVEDRRMQSADNLERIAVILAFVAVRLLQLRVLKKQEPTSSSDKVLTRLEWRCLWRSTEKSAIPKNAPTIHWAYYALAKLGGWYDSKRTGRVGWKAMHKGLSILNDKVDAIEIAQECLEM